MIDRVKILVLCVGGGEGGGLSPASTLCLFLCRYNMAITLLIPMTDAPTAFVHSRACACVCVRVWVAGRPSAKRHFLIYYLATLITEEARHLGTHKSP